MTREFTCELDGYVMHGESDDELVSQVQRHVAQAHPDLVGQLTRDRILEMVRATAGEG